METATSSVIVITEAALAKLSATAQAESVNLEETFLRISVVPGGCSGLTYDLGWDPTAEVFAQLGGVVMPTTVFVDAAGVVRETWSGVLTAEELTAKIAEIT